MLRIMRFVCNKLALGRDAYGIDVAMLWKIAVRDCVEQYEMRTLGCRDQLLSCTRFGNGRRQWRDNPGSVCHV